MTSVNGETVSEDDYTSFTALLASASPDQRTTIGGVPALPEMFVEAGWNQNFALFTAVLAARDKTREQAGTLFRERTDIQQQLNAATANIANLMAARDRYKLERDQLRMRENQTQATSTTPSPEQLQQFFNTLVAGLTVPTGTATTGGSNLSFEVRNRLKEHRIPTYKAEPDLEIIVKFLKEIEHHVRLGGGEGDSTDAKHISLAWTHLDTLRAYPWFVTWIGSPPYNIPEAAFATGGFLGCTWEIFKKAFKAQFGAQHAIQRVRQQLRNLKFNKLDVPGFHQRFLELASMLELHPSAPYTDGIYMDYHAKLPNDLQRTLDATILTFTSVGRTFTLADGFQLVAQDAARGHHGTSLPPSQVPVVSPDPDAMDLSVMRAEFNALQRSGGSSTVRCYGCNGTGHIRADCPSSGGGNSGAAGRERASQPWRRGGGSQGGSGRGGGGRGGGGGGLRGGARGGGSQRALYATDTTEEEEPVEGAEAEADEEIDSGVTISDEELIQWARDEEKGM
jgi:hypothetical protein